MYFGWKHSGSSQSPDCYSSCNVWEKSKMMGYRGMVMKEESILFAWSLGGGQRLWLMKVGTVVCLVLVVVVMVFLEQVS